MDRIPGIMSSRAAQSLTKLVFVAFSRVDDDDDDEEAAAVAVVVEVTAAVVTVEEADVGESALRADMGDELAHVPAVDEDHHAIANR